MNKKFLSAILFGALVASAGSFVSCADNGDDIKQLQDQNSELKAQLAQLKSELQAELKNAANASQVAAIEAKLAAIEAANAENLQATIDALNGKFATKEAVDAAIDMQIAAINAIKNDLSNLQTVDVQSVLDALEKAKENGNADVTALSATVDALDADVNVLVSALRGLVFQPEFYVDGIEAVEYTYLKYVALDPKGDKYTVPQAFSNETSENEEDYATGESISYSYSPRNNKFVIDPAFVWQYAHIGDIAWGVTEWNESSLGHGDWCQHYGSYQACPADGCLEPNNQWGWAVAVPNGWKTVGDNILNTVKFAKNPSNAKVTAEDVNFIVKNICAMTRANEASMKVVSVEDEAGYVTVTYFVPSADVVKLITANNDESLSVLNQKENTTIFKLQSATATENAVESDWAALYETSIQPVAIALNDYAAKAHGAFPAWYAPINCENKLPNELHKNPYEAAADEKRTAEIDYLSDGVDIAKHIELHFVKRDEEKADRKHAADEPEIQHPHIAMTLAEAAYKFGFTYEFKLVPYTIDDNKTNNSAYAHQKDGLYANSIIVPNTVEEGRDQFGGTPKKATEKSQNQKDGYEQGASSVDKEPLVQVLVKKGDDVILDGYVSLIITRTVGNIMAPVFDLGSQDKSCEAINYAQTWNQVSELLYEQTAKEGLGMSKLEFEETYQLVKYTESDAAMQFNVKVDGEVITATPIDYKNTYTEVKQEFDPNGITNTVLTLSLDKFDQQYVYEMKDHTDIIYVMYVRRGTNSHSTWSGIIVPLQIALNEVKGLEYSLKNVNFWYANTGAPTIVDDESIRLNVNYAKDNGNTFTQSTVDVVEFTSELTGYAKVDGFVRDLNDAWEGKALKFNKAGVYTKGAKPVYYFHPLTKNIVVTDEYSGVKYQLDVDSESLWCDIWVNGDDPIVTTGKHEHLISDKVSKEAADFVKKAEYAEQVNTLKGLYTNINLYAYKNGADRQKIAELNRYTGEVWYIHNERAKEVLNATGHRVAEENAIVGIFLPNECDDAYGINYDAIPNNLFPAYFLRPLDIAQTEPDKVIDAVNNASYISLFDKFNFVDWRDYKITNGADYSNIWLLAYYGCNTMTLHLDQIITDMNGHDPMVKLIDVNSDIMISYVEHNKTTVISEFPVAGTKTVNMSAYNKASMGVKSTYDAFVEHFGYLKYENKGANVSNFKFIVPVTFGYDWGEITTTFEVQVIGTEGNHDGE